MLYKGEWYWVLLVWPANSLCLQLLSIGGSLVRLNMADATNPTANIPWYNPVKVATWFLEALLLVDSPMPPPPRDLRKANACRVYFVVGGPCTGKASVCFEVAQKCVFAYCDAEALLRSEAQLDSAEALQIVQCSEEGQPVPQSVLLAVLRRYLQVWLDPFPRSIESYLSSLETIYS